MKYQRKLVLMLFCGLLAQSVFAAEPEEKIGPQASVTFLYDETNLNWTKYKMTVPEENPEFSFKEGQIVIPPIPRFKDIDRIHYVLRSDLPVVGNPLSDNLYLKGEIENLFPCPLFFDNPGDDLTPFYVSGGQEFLPFGAYKNNMIAQPLTQRLGRTKSLPFLLGYRSPNESGFFSEVYVFRSSTADQTQKFGLNSLYRIHADDFKADVGAQYISSIADSMGMQDTGTTPNKVFGGFASMQGSQDIKTVPAVSLFGHFHYKHYQFIAEWLAASKRFDTDDLSFNGNGARPSAAQVEAGVDFSAFEKKSSFFVGYQRSDETLALSVPHHRFSGVFHIALLENMQLSLELRRDLDFPTSSIANGKAPGEIENQSKLASGKSSDTLTAQIKVEL